MQDVAFFQVKLKKNSPVNTKVVNGVKITKKWLIKTGNADDFKVFKDVDVQELIKENDSFVPKSANEVDISDENESEITKSTESNDSDDISCWSEQQLIDYLLKKGLEKKNLKTLSFEDLVQQVKFFEDTCK